jgi:hypothetical protein
MAHHLALEPHAVDSEDPFRQVALRGAHKPRVKTGPTQPNLKRAAGTVGAPKGHTAQDECHTLLVSSCKPSVLATVQVPVGDGRFEKKAVEDGRVSRQLPPRSVHHPVMVHARESVRVVEAHAVQQSSVSNGGTMPSTRRRTRDMALEQLDHSPPIHHRCRDGGDGEIRVLERIPGK